MAYDEFSGLDMTGVEFDTEDTVLETAEPQPYDLRELTDKLFSLPPNFYEEYNPWIDALTALKNTDPKLKYLADVWSQQSLTKYRPDVFERTWNSLCQRAVANPITIGSIYFWAAEHERSRIQPSKFQGMGLADFLKADFKIDYLIDGILVEGQPCIVGGPKKALKTLTILEAGLCLAHGLPFMGRYETKQRRVAIFSGESGVATLQERARAILLSMGVSEPDNDSFRIYEQLPHFNGPLDDFKRELEKYEIQVAFVDPAFKCLDGTDAGNGFKMYEQLGRADAIFNELGITFLLAHHYTKAASQEFTPGDLSDLSWSGFAEWARQWWLLSRQSPYEDDGKHELFMRVGGSAGHTNLFHRYIDEGIQPNRYWQQECRTKAEAVADALAATYQEVVDKVRRVFADNCNTPLSKTGLRDTSGIRTARLDASLPRLLDDGILTKFEEGRYTYYKLGDTA